MQSFGKSLCCLMLGLLILALGGLTPGAEEDPVQRYFKSLAPASLEQPIQPQALGSEENVMIPMRDGVRLAATIYKPMFPKPQMPVILVRSPYDRSSVDLTKYLLLLQDYILVAQDARGRFGSEGEDRVFQDDGWGELQDGYDTIEWIAAQPWCNGKVGTWGPSALGIAQGMAAGAVPPHLVCQLITFAPARGYGETAYQGGVYRKALIEGWLTKNNSTHMIPIYQAHPTFDSFWEIYDIASRFPLINVPCLFIGGWYDCFQQGTLDSFVGRQTLGAEGAKGNQRLVVGPWTHVNEFEAKQGELTYPSNSIYTEEIFLTLDWFAYWLLGKSNGAMDGPPVKYYVMGDSGNASTAGNIWKTSETWPPFEQTVPFYLTPQAGLATTPPSMDGSLPLLLDPQNPVPTQGGQNLEIPAGPFDQRTLESRNDVLVFTTPVLEKPLEITGRIKAVLYASSILPDTDLAVRLTDVYPDGRSMLVTDGILRASFRDSWSNPEPITPGAIYCYEIDLWSSSIVFDPGHQVRVIVSNTNYPRFDLNPVYQQIDSGVTAATQIHMSPVYPSHILLPTQSEGPVSIEDWFLQ